MSPISRDPQVMGGELCFAGTRVPVKSLFDWLEDNYTIHDFLQNFPTVSMEQVQAVLEMATEKLLAVSAAP